MQVSGTLVPAGGALKVVAGQGGRITARHVREGQQVAAGQRLFDLTAERIGASGSIEARVKLQLAERREQIGQRRDAALGQLTLRAGALADQLRLAEAEVANHRGAISIGNEQVKSARATYERYATLARRDFVAPALLAQYKNALNIELAKRNALALNLGNAQRALLQVKQEAATLAGQGTIARAEASQNLAALDQEAAELDGRSAATVTAPAAGVVTALGFNVGQAVAAGTVLATVLPAGAKLEAQLLVPSRASAVIARGQPVLLRLDAFPYQKYGMLAGTVEQIELSPATDTPAGAPLYRATVSLSADAVLMHGKRTPLESGMPLEADIFHDRRRLIEWVFDPLLSAAKGRAPLGTRKLSSLQEQHLEKP